jgi:hypothetical protein
MKSFILAGLLLSTTSLFAQEKKSGDKVIYKYKEYESIDLGGLEVKGNIVAPGDISVKERERKEFSRDLLERPHFDPEVVEDVRNLR